jgi:hypothetical protein
MNKKYHSTILHTPSYILSTLTSSKGSTSSFNPYLLPYKKGGGREIKKKNELGC